jgi:RNA polymerase sigma-70 factor (ECF subfamily)
MERAEEASQETFVRAYFSLSKLKDQGAFFSWLFGIGSRVAQELQRDEAKRRRVAHLLPKDTPRPEMSSDYVLEKAISELDEPYRQIILLRYYGPHTCEEVARQMNMPLGTVTKYLSRAYAMLKQSLARIEKSEVRS